jgi:hypothetical protein
MDSLPHELVQEILFEIDNAAICNLCLVNNKYRDLASCELTCRLGVSELSNQNVARIAVYNGDKKLLKLTFGRGAMVTRKLAYRAIKLGNLNIVDYLWKKDWSMFYPPERKGLAFEYDISKVENNNIYRAVGVIRTCYQMWIRDAKRGGFEDIVKILNQYLGPEAD